MWGRKVDGVVLRFHLAGINNQNFIMQDEQTGSFWQQISGRAISGPLAGKQLNRVASDELTFGLWRTEQPNGSVLHESAPYAAEYAPKDWDVKMRHRPVVISHEGDGLAERDIVLAMEVDGKSRAYRYDRVLRDGVVQSPPVILAVGPDRTSVRAFETGNYGDFYRLPESGVLVDSVTGSRWNFEGCATEGKSKGACLSRVQVTKDYWFDWREYNPNARVY